MGLDMYLSAALYTGEYFDKDINLKRVAGAVAVRFQEIAS